MAPFLCLLFGNVIGIDMSRFSFHGCISIKKFESTALFLGFSLIYVFLAWVVCGGETWWIVDYVDSSNVFYGDDAYRFFLARSAWSNLDLYTYNFVLPGFLLLDGLVVSIARGDLFVSRSIHALFAGLSMALIWRSGRFLRVDKIIMMSAILVVGLLPRFALTSLSFYGEAWLMFILCGLIYFFLHKNFFWVSVLASLLPLIRPEGMFFWVPLCLFFAVERKWKEVMVMIIPGFLYFIYLNVALPSFSDYGYWRLELRKILNQLVLNKSSWDWVDTYSMLFVFPAFFGFLYRPLRVLWPVLVGGAMWFGWLILLVVGGYSDYEDRYTFILIPIMGLMWAGFFEWVRGRIELKGRITGLFPIIILVYALVIVISHFSNMYMLKGSVRYIGVAATLENIVLGNWSKLFMHYAPETNAAWRGASSQIESMLANDPGIDRVIIFDHVFYYFLDPRRLPDNVVVGYATNGYRVFHILFDGQVFAQHPGGKMYSYFDFSQPNFEAGEKRAIYVDLMPLSGYPYTWKFADYEMHLFSYQDSLSPRKSLDNAPMIDVDLMKKAYEKWW